MEILKNISKITAMLLLCNDLSHAGWKTLADENISIQSSSPTSLSTSLTRSFSGGSARVQWRNLGSINIINMTSPLKADVGCNGIEIGFGSISFLDFDELVNKLKMIASQAPAFAFKMAIDTACSQCSTIMQDLEQAVEAINGFSLDSCAIAENVGSPIGASLGSVINPSASRYADGYEATKAMTADKSTFKLNEIKDTINSWSDTVNGKSLKLEQLKGYGSFLNNLRINKIPALNNMDAKEFIEIVRTLVGDVVGYMKKENGNQDTYDEISANPAQDINTLVDLFLGEIPGGKGEFIKTKVVLDGNNSEWTEVSTSNIPTGYFVYGSTTDSIVFDDTQTTDTKKFSWTKKIQLSFEKVVTKIKNKDTLTSSDYEYLQNLPYNGYRIINYFAANSTAGSITIEEYAKYVAIANVKYELELILRLAATSITDYLNDTKKLSTTNRDTQVALYKQLRVEVTKQLENLRKNDDIKSMSKYEEKIKKLLGEDYKESRQQGLGK